MYVTGTILFSDTSTSPGTFSSMISNSVCSFTFGKTRTSGNLYIDMAS